MKRTVYFTEPGNHPTSQIKTIIKKITDRRDDWLRENENIIGRIDSEDIKIVPWNGNNQYIIIVIKLTYYPK